MNQDALIYNDIANCSIAVVNKIKKKNFYPYIQNIKLLSRVRQIHEYNAY